MYAMPPGFKPQGFNRPLKSPHDAAVGQKLGRDCAAGQPTGT